MLMSQKHNFIFVHIYKNAGSSITRALRPFALPRWQWKTHQLLKKAGIPSPFFEPRPLRRHATASQMIEVLGADEFESYFSFAIVRNPWDWQVSFYKYVLKKKKHHQHELIEKLGSFDEYIKWRCENEVRYQKDFIYSESDELLVDYVGRFENLESDFDRICSRIGISVSLPKLNVSNTSPYQGYYTDETRELVREVFASDIERFGYEF